MSVSASLKGEIIVVPQNDPKVAGEQTPAEKWTDAVFAALGRKAAKLVRVPAQFKDANDWIKVAPASEIIAAV